MTKKERAAQAVLLLKEAYPDAVCSLTYQKPYELLIAVRLSAQCTDARVNLITPHLFAAYPTLEALAGADVEDVGRIIKSCGLYRTKARDIVALSGMLLDDYGGVVPDEIDELLRLPGVGRKTANLIVGDVYGKPAVVCDTHCIRITNLLGLTTTKDPLKCERELRACLPMDEANDFCHRLVLHGRAVCVARRPQCGVCAMAPVCKFAREQKKSAAKRTAQPNA
jgi:endonuclease-3